MRIHLKNYRTKFHPDPIWNDGALGFLKESGTSSRLTTTTWGNIRPKQEEQEQDE